MKRIITAALLSVIWVSGFSQGATDYGSGMKFNLNEDGTKYMRFIAWNQIWLRSSQMNPGTMIADEPATKSTDIGNRRLRFLIYAQLSKRYMIVTHFGINNQSFTSGGASGSIGTGGYGIGKKPACFFTMPGTSMHSFYPKKTRNSAFLLVADCIITWACHAQRCLLP